MEKSTHVFAPCRRASACDDNPLFGFVPARNKATRWIVHLRTEVFSLGAQYINDVFFVFDPECARRSRALHAG
ncbi:hypothetical protein AT5A_20406 [Agrobacterium tumefaciens 5A]|nr:hypothetical protein AT5A_20406 [Agrobacterium tumefaciens 5A]